MHANFQNDYPLVVYMSKITFTLADVINLLQ